MKLCSGLIISCLFLGIICSSSISHAQDIKFNDISSWRIEQESGASLELKKGSRDNPESIEMIYDLGNGNWVQIWRVLDTDISKDPYLRMEIKATGFDNILQIKYVDDDGSTFGTEIKDLIPSSDWTEIAVGPNKFKHFWGGDKKLNKSRVVRIYLAVTRMSGGSGKVWIKGLKFQRSGIEKKKPAQKQKKSKPAIKSGLSDWNAGGESGTSVNLTSAPGKEGTALKIDYDMGSGTWLQIRKKFTDDLSDKRYLRFWLKGVGSANNLQVKIEDMDGSTFGVNMEGATDAPVWEYVQLPQEKFEHFWGGDASFDWKHPKRLYFAITKYEGGSGSVLIDSIEFADKKLDIKAPGLPADDTPVIFSMESVSGWGIGGESGTSFDMVVAEGHDGNSIAVDYDIGSGTWIQMQKRIKLNIEKKNIP